MANDGFEWMQPRSGSARAQRCAEAGARADGREPPHLGSLRAQVERLNRRVQQLEHEREEASWSPPQLAPEVPAWAARVGVGIAVGLSALAGIVQAARQDRRGVALRASRALGALLASPRSLLFS